MSEQKPKIKKALTYSDIERRKFKTLEFEGEWLEHLGKPEVTGSMLIFGDSGHGKTTYALQLVRYLCQFQKVHINTVEEGVKESFWLSLKRNQMKSVETKFTFQKEKYDELVARLRQKRQPKIVVIDSLQYFFRRKNIDHYLDLIQEFPNTHFIWISHADGSKPKGDLADFIRYDSDNVVFVKDFEAENQKSRYNGRGEKIINEEEYTIRKFKISN